MKNFSKTFYKYFTLVVGLVLVSVSWQATEAPAADDLLTEFRRGPMSNFTDVVFCARKPNPTDGHYYANFGYYAHDPYRKAWGEGTKLCRLNLATGRVVTLLEDAQGGIRDPQVYYDGNKILFAYRKSGTENYLLYEINVDGSGLRQITTGQFDDFEPSYLPDGTIVFVSSRCKRWVNCWLTQVAVLHRCGPNGENIHAISSNNEQDNTPWPLSDGRILYTRWEYVDRSQVDYHGLWVSNPDGTSQMNWYGNQEHRGTVMIDAKPIPGSDKVVAIFSPWHGQSEHAGKITVVDPKAGPDAQSFAKQISPNNQFRDPWAFNEHAFMAALGPTLVLLDDQGKSQEIYRLPEVDIAEKMQLSEPRPIMARPREAVIADRVNLNSPTGYLLLSDIYEGRNMKGVNHGDIRKLLVLETLPMPVHYTGGMDPISYGGTFTLERILGTIPVEADGSAYMELPAGRSFFFVALDKNDLSVKRMQSFLTVQPGETTSCVGCHEQRTRTPKFTVASTTVQAVLRPHSRIKPIVGVPDVIDFPRDIQPILDALCVKCHGYKKTAAGGPRAGQLILSGDRGPMFSQSYYMLTIAGLFKDGRNAARSNYDPRTLGSSASRLLTMLDDSHYGVRATPEQKQLLRLWIETGATYPGTYAALGTGMIGGYAENQEVDTDENWPTTQSGAKVIAERCASCHETPERILPRSLSDERGVSFWQPDMHDPRLRTSRHIVFNLTHPDQSLLLLAPLAPAAGGWGLCRDPKTKEPRSVFTSTKDPDYKSLLAMCASGQQHLDKMKRFDMPGFRPRPDWFREMKRYGILDTDLDTAVAVVDYYNTERRYWESLWPQPSRPFLYASEGAKKILSYDRAGKVVWEYPAEMSRDVWRLPNGNVLFCYNDNYDGQRNDNPSGVMEVTPDKKIVFHFKTTGQVWACQRLTNGNTLVGAASQGKLLVVDPLGSVVKTIILRNKPGHSCLRYARVLPNGNFLVAEESSHTVCEYDAEGALVREILTEFLPFAAVRLANGNTVISGQFGIVEVDPAGKNVWRLNVTDVQELGIRWFAGVQVLPNGNLFVCNAGGKVPVFEINRAKHIVWQCTEQLPLGHGVQQLDVMAIDR